MPWRRQQSITVAANEPPSRPRSPPAVGAARTFAPPGGAPAARPGLPRSAPERRRPELGSSPGEGHGAASRRQQSAWRQALPYQLTTGLHALKARNEAGPSASIIYHNRSRLRPAASRARGCRHCRYGPSPERSERRAGGTASEQQGWAAMERALRLPTPPPAPGIQSVWNRTAFWPCLWLKMCPELQPAQNVTQLRCYRSTTLAASPSSPSSTATAREVGAHHLREGGICASPIGTVTKS